MATTTNYSWTTPDDTDLVKDGASAIRSLGTAIDSTVFTNAGNAVQKSTIDAKGDLLVGTADNTVGRLAVGTNNYVLTADSTEASGMKWAAAAGITYSAMNTVATEQSTTSTSFTDLATVGPSVTVTTGTTAVIVISCGLDNEASGRAPRVGFAVSGASTIAATSTQCLRLSNSGARSSMQSSVVYVVSGLTAGSNTFTLKYLSTDGGTVSFVNRNVFVIY
jgi:hypothetical protein